MTEEKKYTEREVVLRERAAFEGAINSCASCVQDNSMRYWLIQDAPLRARMNYPFSVRMRGVRVTLSDGSVCWRVDSNYCALWRTGGGSSFDYAISLLTRTNNAEDFRQVARLLDNEQEPVPENET